MFFLYHLWAIFIWILIGLLLFGLGDLFNNLLSLKHFNWFKTTWLGLLYTTILLQLIHIFSPINQIVLLILSSISIVWIVYRFGKDSINKIKKAFYNNNSIKKYLLWIFLSIIILILFANFSYTQNIMHDVGLYYLPTVKWIMSEKIVFGLTNLHGRFGFNNSSLLFSSLISNIPGTGEEWRFISGFFILLTLVKSFKIVHLCTKNKKISLHHIYYILLAVIILIYAISGGGRNLANFSPDILVFLLEIIIFGELLKIIKDEISLNDSIFIILMSGLLITIKLSGIIFALIASSIAFIYLIKHLKRDNRKKTISTILSVSFTLILIWMLRGIMLSGYLLYPQELIHFNLPWTISAESVKEMNCWISGWAKEPFKQCTEVNNNWNWIKEWIKAFTKETHIVISLITGIISIIASFFFYRKDFFKFLLLLLSIIIPTSILWFISAPDPRFLGGLIVIFLVSPIAYIQYSQENKANILPAILIVTIISSLMIRSIISNQLDTMISNTEDKSNKYEVLETHNKNEIKKPIGSDQCWTIEQPCTPYFDESLRIDNSGYWKIITLE